MKCKICKSTTKKIFVGKILKKYDCKYYQCDYCGFIQTENPYWLDEAYKDPINLTDTGILKRNLDFRDIVSVIIRLFFRSNGKFVDYGGGYGIFTRLMRDIGFDYYWSDPMTNNLFARGFEYNQKSEIELVTAFECLEHFVGPLVDLGKILKISKNIIFTTNLVPKPTPKLSEWWYYGLEHGQHVSFFTEKTLQFIANNFGLNYYNLGGMGLFTKKTINRKLLTLTKTLSPVLVLFIKSNKRSLTISDMKHFI